MNAIEIKKLVKSYDSKDVFLGIDLIIEQGKLVAIVGESGSGKTTLMNILALLDFNYSGEYKLFGIDVGHQRESQLAYIRNKEIGMVFQNYNLFENLNVQENVLLPYKYSKARLNDAEKQRISGIMTDLNIGHLKEKKIKYLSGGEKQRVGIARALAMNPRIILADEPTGNLDIDNRNTILEYFLKMKQIGKTIIVITHDNSCLQMFDSVIRISDGALSYE